MKDKDEASQPFGTEAEKEVNQTPENNKGKRFKIGTVVVIAFLILYIPSLIHWIYGNNIRTDIIRIGNIEDSVSTEGILIRDEEVLISNSSGSLITDAGEGERVSANSRVATVLSSSSKPLMEKLKEKNQEIIDEQTKKADNVSMFSDDISKIEGMIDQKARQLAYSADSNSLADVDIIKNDIEGLMEKRAAVLGSLPTSDKHINALIAERDALKKQIDTGTENITVQTPGIISYNVDGFEELLKPEAADRLTPKQLAGIKNSKLLESPANIKISTDKPFAKVIRGNQCLIAAVLDKKEAALFKKDESITLRINDIESETDNAVITRISPVDGKYVVIIKIDRFMNETAAMRRISVDLIKNSEEGLKVPLKSLFNIDYSKGEADIILVKWNCAYTTRVKVLLKNNDYAVVESTGDKTQSGVNLYDIYVVDPRNIKEGQIIQQ